MLKPRKINLKGPTADRLADAIEYSLSRTFRQEYVDLHYTLTLDEFSKSNLPEERMNSVTIEEKDYRKIESKGKKIWRRYSIRIMRDEPTLVSFVNVTFYPRMNRLSGKVTSAKFFSKYDLGVKRQIANWFQGTVDRSRDGLTDSDSNGFHCWYTIEPRKALNIGTVIEFSKRLSSEPFLFGSISIIPAYGPLSPEEIRGSNVRSDRLSGAICRFSKNSEAIEFEWTTRTNRRFKLRAPSPHYARLQEILTG